MKNPNFLLLFLDQNTCVCLGGFFLGGVFAVVLMGEGREYIRRRMDLSKRGEKREKAA